MSKRTAATASKASKRGKKAKDDEGDHPGFSKSTWWLVDLQSDITGGATPLVKRCMKEYGWTEQYCRRVLEAYRQFLSLKEDYGDLNAEILSPSLPVDQMWHMHILDTPNYATDCSLLCGDFIHHDVDGGNDVKARQERLDTTKEALLKKYPSFDREIWRDVWDQPVLSSHVPPVAPASPVDSTNIINICIRHPTGEETFFKIKKSTRMWKVFDMYASMQGVSRDCIPFLLNGERIMMEATPSLLNLQDGDSIDAKVPQGGC